MSTKAELIDLIKRSPSLVEGDGETSRSYLTALRHMREELVPKIVFSAPEDAQASHRHG